MTVTFAGYSRPSLASAPSVADRAIALTPLGSWAVGAWLGLGTPTSDALYVKVTLDESADPVIWRRLRVPADIRLDRFNQVLGAAMGWQDSHLHVFEHGSDRYGFPEPDLDISDDREVTLGALLVHPGDRLAYEYDFGDSWEHEIVLEAVEQGGHDGPRCLDGAGRCPPEDVGGTPGYEDLRRVLADLMRTGTPRRSSGWASSMPATSTPPPSRWSVRTPRSRAF